MDTFIEQLVNKKRTGMDIVKTIIIIVLAILIPLGFVALGFVINPYLIVVGFFVFLLLIYFAWYLIVSLNQEFEYAITNDNITVDKVIAKRRRKKVLDMNINEFDDFAKVSSGNFDNKKFAKYYIACDDMNNENNYGATFNSETYGSSVLIFTPNEKVIDSIKPHLNIALRRKLMKEEQ